MMTIFRCPSAYWLAALVWLAATPSSADTFDSVRRRIDKELVESQTASLTVAVARDGKIVWEEGFGWADREQRIPATPHTMYSLASISKPITATGLMVLVERGRLDLDQEANEYLGDARLRAHVGEANDVTLRRLANHTSGLPLHYQFFYEDEPFQPPTRDESIRRYGHLMFKPGQRYQYANFGYGVLDHIIARQSDMSYAEFMRREVFLPLDMTRTSVGLPAELKKYQAVRYQDQRPLPFYRFDHPGASAVYSSAHDLVRFGSFHLKHRGPRQKAILKDASIDEMHRATAIIRHPHRGYGVGWFVNEDEYGVHTVSHSGGMGGVRTRLTLAPSEGIAVVALCNSNSSLPLRATEWILAAMLPQYAKHIEEATKKKKEIEAKASQGKSGEEKAGDANAFDPPGALVGHWSGAVHTYQGRRPLQMWIQEDGDVHVQFQGQLKTLLNEPRVDKDYLTGVMHGDIGTDDANRRAYHLHLRLRLRGLTLGGSCKSISLPGPRPGNALSYWTELTKCPMRLIKPITLFDGKRLDGWRVLDVADFEDHGAVEVKDGQIVLGRGKPASGIGWKRDFPRTNYELTLDAKRVEGGDFFCGLTFPIDDTYCTLILGGWGGGVTGLSNIDNMSAVENETTDYIEFEQDRWYRLKLRVSARKIEAWVDDKMVVDVTTKDHKFSIWWEQEPARPFGIASWNTKAAVRNIRIRPLGDKPGENPGAKPGE